LKIAKRSYKKGQKNSQKGLIIRDGVTSMFYGEIKYTIMKLCFFRNGDEIVIITF